MIIDAHAHVWPDHIAPRVLAGRPAGLSPVHDGTLDGLRRCLDGAGVDMAMCLGVAHVARNVPATNEFIGSVDRSQFIPFGTVHPDLRTGDNLRSLRDNGIRGVKLHPLFQDVALGDPRVLELMTALAEDGVVVITHAGGGGDQAAAGRGSPKALRRLADAVPGLRLIACHFGGYQLLDEAETVLAGAAVMLDTSWPPSLGGLDPDRIRRLIERHGTSRVVFGSDWPMADPAAEIKAVKALGLTAAAQDAILGGNLARILGLESSTGPLPGPPEEDAR